MHWLRQFSGKIPISTNSSFPLELLVLVLNLLSLPAAGTQPSLADVFALLRMTHNVEWWLPPTLDPCMLRLLVFQCLLNNFSTPPRSVQNNAADFVSLTTHLKYRNPEA